MKTSSSSSSSYFLASTNSCMILFASIIFQIVCCCEGAIKLPPNVTVPAVFAFGDSIVDQGNNNGITTMFKCNFAPYGKDFQGAVATGRFSNGRTPIDLLASQLGIKEFVPAYLDPNLKAQDLPTGVSFASGGSGYDPETARTVSVIAMPDQLNHFKEYIGKLKAAVGEENGNKILSNSLFLVVAGSNDLANTYFTTGIAQTQYDVASYTDLMVSSASTFIQELYKLGARRIGVFGAPPLGCVPAQRTLLGGLMRMCSDKENEAAKLYNSKLSPVLDSLTKGLPQSRVVYVEIYNTLLDIILHPQNYGFEVSDRGCCGTGSIEAAIMCNRFDGMCEDDSKYVFWDSYHPTEKTYKILVDQILQKYVGYLA